MARRRMIDPSFWTDEKVGKLSPHARLTFIALWNFAEDSGVGRGNMNYLKNTIFPYDNISLRKFKEIFEEICRSGMIEVFEYDGQSYYYILNFKKHQKIKRPLQTFLPIGPGKNAEKNSESKAENKAQNESEKTAESQATSGSEALEDVPRDTQKTVQNFPNDGASAVQNFPIDGKICSRDFLPKEKKIKEKKIKEEKRAYGSLKNIPLAESEYRALTEKFGLRGANAMIEQMSLYTAAGGKTYLNYYAALLRWAEIGYNPPAGISKFSDFERASLMKTEEEIL